MCSTYVPGGLEDISFSVTPTRDIHLSAPVGAGRRENNGTSREPISDRAICAVLGGSDIIVKQNSSKGLPRLNSGTDTESPGA